MNVHIDRLVVDDVLVSRGEHDALGAAVEHELGRLLGKGGLSPALAAGGSLATVRTPSAAVGGTSPTAFGIQIASSIYGGIGT